MVSYLISFFGPDGAGKSTQVELVKEYLESNGVKVRKVWIRSPHTLAFLMSRILVKIGFYRVATNPYGMQVKLPAVDANRTIRSLWSVIELISVLPLIMLRVYIPLALGYTLVAERYVIDTAVTIGYFGNDPGFLRSWVTKILLHFIPKNTVFIHLDSDYSTIMKRRGPIVEPYEFIQFQRIGYGSIEGSLSAAHINTSTMSITETSAAILKWLETRGIIAKKARA